MSGTEHAAAAGHGAQGGFDPGATILHHILDSNDLEIPFTGAVVHLPRIQIGPFDLSITRNVVMMWVACALILLLFWVARRQAARQTSPGGLRGALETVILFIRDDIVRKSIGHGGDRYLPFLLTAFFFILVCALIGLVPGLGTATTSISVTATLAVMVLVVSQIAGMREHGVARHFRNLVPHGLPVWLLPVMIVVEALGVFSRPFALAIRLFANMMAGHVVIISLLSLIFIAQSVFAAGAAVPFTLFIFVLEILVAFIQAYIFTMLAALFIGMSIHPAH